ncbi:MAG: ABC transporter permease [Gammaproteobacteria bacterium]|nr:ABC transporter permease [Gammaproteobacteria bacterium]
MTEITPAIACRDTDEGRVCVLEGTWNLSALGPVLDDISEELATAAKRPEARGAESHWDLCSVNALDSAGALLLWRAWGRRFPAGLDMRDEHRSLFEKWTHEREGYSPPRKSWSSMALAWLARFSRASLEHMRGGILVIGQFALDLGTLARYPSRIPWREMSATIFHTGAKALGITALVGVLIGVVIAYQSAMQLKLYGGEIFIVNILSFSITRELGPILAAILVAGRSGSSMTAQLGVMRLTQELDAMTVLGMSVSQRLVLPKVIGLTIALPLLTMWTIILAMLGGMVASNLALGMPYQQFIRALPDTMPLVNLWIGLGKAAVFGTLIGLTAAYFGLRVQPNTQSLAVETTRSVVTAITLVIVLDAVFSVMLRGVGWS